MCLLFKIILNYQKDCIFRRGRRIINHYALETQITSGATHNATARPIPKGIKTGKRAKTKESFNRLKPVVGIDVWDKHRLQLSGTIPNPRLKRDPFSVAQITLHTFIWSSPQVDGQLKPMLTLKTTNGRASFRKKGPDICFKGLTEKWLGFNQMDL
ncbi:hypothetical protein TNCV_2139401 [Trichonephila clavipes]|uniref:Uncharacterized protein n=1 Tax=Trichonephila clavipes TaxID=2585209 RepID=A0A8X6S4V5_TRICX|nr:hypothetical protein TNCV_2139401 [Trichonephila clavipes]